MFTMTAVYPNQTGLHALIENVTSTHLSVLNSTSGSSIASDSSFIAVRLVFISIIEVLILSGSIFSIFVTHEVTTLEESTKMCMKALAVTDALTGFLSISAVILSIKDKSLFSEPFNCKIYVALQLILFCYSSLLIVFINVDRYIAVTRPYQFPKLCSRKRIIALTPIAVVSSIIVGVSFVFALNLEVQYFDVLYLCFFRRNSSAYLLLLFLADLVPVTTLTCVYIHIIKISKNHEKRVNQGPNNDSNNKALKTFLVVTLTYLWSLLHTSFSFGNCGGLF